MFSIYLYYLNNSKGGIDDLMSKQSKQTAKYKEALKTYNKLAKKADRRMRELERFSRYKEFKSILNYAYRIAKRDIEAWTPPGQKERSPRWQRNTPMDTRSLLAKISDIEKFLRLPTSTMSGTRKIYIKRTETINKKYGTSFTWQSLADYYESGLAEEGNGKFGSKTMLVSIGEIQKEKTDVIEALKNKTEITIQTSSNKVNHTIKELLANNGLQLLDILDK